MIQHVTNPLYPYSNVLSSRSTAISCRQNLTGLFSFSRGRHGNLSLGYVIYPPDISVESPFGTADGEYSAEVTIGLVCINAPALRPLLQKFSGNMLSKSSSRASSVDQESGTTGSSGRAGSIALGSIQRPEKVKARSRNRDDSSSSVEQFRPNDINRTITEIGTTSETDGYGHEGEWQDHQHQHHHDQTGESGAEDHAGCECNFGILRKMEVAVTVSDRV